MIENCRGQDAKRDIVRRYYVELVARLRLYDGQSVVGCCGKVTTEYFVFRAKAKTSTDVQCFIAGSSCGRQFLDILDLDLPPLFGGLAKPEKLSKPDDSNSDDKRSVSRRVGVNLVSESVIEEMTPLNEQLYDAIHLLIVSWGGRCDGLLANILIYLREQPEIDTKDWAIVAFNKIVKSDRKGRTLPNMIAEVRRKNPSLKYYDFSLIQKVLMRNDHSPELFKVRQKVNQKNEDS